jgi:hypothetical protein
MFGTNSEANSMSADVGRQITLERGDDRRKNAFDPRCGHDFNTPGNGAPVVQRSARNVKGATPNGGTGG